MIAASRRTLGVELEVFWEEMGRVVVKVTWVWMGGEYEEGSFLTSSATKV